MSNNNTAAAAKSNAFTTPTVASSEDRKPSFNTMASLASVDSVDSPSAFADVYKSGVYHSFHQVKREPSHRFISSYYSSLVSL